MTVLVTQKASLIIQQVINSVKRCLCINRQAYACKSSQNNYKHVNNSKITKEKWKIFKSHLPQPFTNPLKFFKSNINTHNPIFPQTESYKNSTQAQSSSNSQHKPNEIYAHKDYPEHFQPLQRPSNTQHTCHHSDCPEQ